MSLFKTSSGTNIYQLHARLMKEREMKMQQAIPSVQDTEMQREDNLAGRDFFVSKKFDVGDFEQDLRRVQNAYTRLEAKYNEHRAMT